MNPSAQVQAAKAHITAAAVRSGRSAEEIELLVVSKTIAVERLLELVDVGVVDGRVERSMRGLGHFNPIFCGFIVGDTIEWIADKTVNGSA